MNSMLGEYAMLGILTTSLGCARFLGYVNRIEGMLGGWGMRCMVVVSEMHRSCFMLDG